MGADVVFAIVLTGLVGVSAVALSRKLQRRDAWRAPGFIILPRQEAGPPLELGDVTVAVAYRRGYDGSWTTTLAARCPGLPPSLALSPQGLSSKPGDVRTLDPVFDAIADVRGALLDVAARLGPEVRAAVLTGFLMQEDGRVDGGAASRSHHGKLTGEALRAAAARLAGVARAIGHGETGDRLAANAAAETDPGLQRRCEALLMAHFPEHPRAQAVAARAIASPDRWRRALAAGALGDQPRLDAVVHDIVAGDGGPVADDAVAEAVAHLFGRIPGGEQLLLSLIAVERPAVRLVAIAALGETGSLAAVEPLLRWTRLLVGGELELVARRALARIRERTGVGDDAGRLSLAHASGGELAIATSEEEGVPTARDESGR